MICTTGLQGTFTNLEVNFKSTSFVGDGIVFKSLSLGVEFTKITPTSALFYKSQTDVVVFGGALPKASVYPGLEGMIHGGSNHLPVFGGTVVSFSQQLQIGFSSPLFKLPPSI